MKNLNKEIGERIRFVRSIFNEGAKLSASQFAHLLGETMHKILNYELGRAQVPPSFLVALYRKGINPIFILTGEGGVFAPNKYGFELKQKLGEHLKKEGKEKFNIDSDLESHFENSNNFSQRENLSERNIKELIELARQYTAVAGDIMEIIKSRGQNE